MLIAKGDGLDGMSLQLEQQHKTGTPLTDSQMQKAAKDTDVLSHVVKDGNKFCTALEAWLRMPSIETATEAT